SGATLIVPINFPLPFDVSDPVLAKMISFGEMKHWEMAPSNAAKLFENQITFCLTSAGIEEKDSFLSSLRKAVQYGLPEGAALNALTASPAKLIRCENSIGKIAVGYRANFFMTNTSLFEPSSQILTSWIDGKEFFVSKEEGASKDGSMTLVLQDKKLSFEIEKQKGVYTGKLKVKHTDLPTDFRTSNDSVWVNLSMNIEDEFVYGDLLLDSAETRYRFSGKIFNDMECNGQLSSPLGQSFSFLGKFEPKQNKEENKKRESAPNLGSVIYPFTAYGSVELPKAENVIFRNATLWTCENGVVENGDLWIKDGKIAGIGKDFVLPKGVSCIEIDATGKHISPGIIDEHSHIALSSVNEGSQASSAEVEEGSVIYPEDIDIYRQLSGGTTASQLLHGSANPIGGQSALIKLKWGASAEEMKIKNAPGFIKFALGENVKQSNWGDRSTTRFPQTRMGVEQVYYDYFYRALEYGKAWEEYNAACKKTKKGLPMPLEPRRDLELETLYEILKKERFITCHSYVQSEINMLMHVADSFGFKINTFTHILEGYKVADKMKAHGAGASTFSDWWAYKAEVKDAIPYNAALMYEQGIVVAINSDDAEMGARLNQEAAKASKYGGVPKEEALKMVTLNPAKLLHLDDRMGSLRVGKDADFVIWSEEPLSIYARAEKTYIDGICYFDLKRDSELRAAFNLEREILIQKMLDAKNGGSATRQPSRKPPHHFHCDSMDETSRGIFIKE
ncbi:MAG: amidohydrolase family protein, partial [Bacteroidota bacterium]